MNHKQETTMEPMGITIIPFLVLSTEIQGRFMLRGGAAGFEPHSQRPGHASNKKIGFRVWGFRVWGFLWGFCGICG